MKNIFIILIVCFFTNSILAQDCINFEGSYPITNWTVGCCLAQSISTDSNITYNKYLQLVDGSGGSFTVNKTTEFSGNWLLKAQSGCLCFDYKAHWNSALPYPVSVPKLQIFNNSGTAINSMTGIHAAFVGNVGDPNILIDVWKKYCLPIGLSSAGNLPSNSYGTWKIYNASTQLIGAAASAAWDNLIINVSGIFLTSDYTADPSEVISFDNFCFTCTDGSSPNPNTTPSNPCCKNSLSFVSATTVPPSYPYNGGTYSIENFNVNIPNDIPITEIKVNVESFEILSAYKDCLKCDNKPATLGSLMGIKTIGSGANTLTLASQPYGSSANANNNINELIWSNPYGVNLNTSDKLGILYVLPSSNDIPCCATKAKVCIRISWRDINCNYCEVFTCSTIDLKNPKDLKAGFQLPSLQTLYLNSKGIYVTGHSDGF